MRTNTLVLALVALVLATGCRTAGPPRTDPPCGLCSGFLTPVDEPLCSSMEAAPSAAGTPRFENLVFKGGGVKGIAYPGAIGAFGDQRLAGVKRVAGTSAGAITAMIVSLGYDAQEICEVTFGIDFAKFEDGSFPADVKRLVERFGWFKGDFAHCLLECLVERKTGSRRTTFAELHDRARENPKFKDLYVFGSDINNRRSVEFSNENPETRDVAIADAARISMSIPFFFVPREFDGDVFVDGGLLRNYPLRVFDTRQANPATLGFFLGTEPPRQGVEDLKDFTEMVFETLKTVQIDALCDVPADVERSVFIDTLGVKAVQFDLSRQLQRALFKQGRIATEKYLSETTHATTCPEFPPPPPE